VKDPSSVKPAFLEALERLGTVRAAAAACGTSHPTLYRWRKEDEAFAASWEEALEACVERRSYEADDQIRKLAMGEAVDAEGRRIDPNVTAAIAYAKRWDPQYRLGDRVGVSVEGRLEHAVDPAALAAAATQAALALKSMVTKRVEERRAQLLPAPPAEVVQVPRLVGGSFEMVDVPKAPEEEPLTPEEKDEIDFINEREKWHEEHRHENEARNPS